MKSGYLGNACLAFWRPSATREQEEDTHPGAMSTAAE